MIQELNLIRNAHSIECPHLINKEELYLGQYPAIALPRAGITGYR